MEANGFEAVADAPRSSVNMRSKQNLLSSARIQQRTSTAGGSHNLGTVKRPEKRTLHGKSKVARGRGGTQQQQGRSQAARGRGGTQSQRMSSTSRGKAGRKAGPNSVRSGKDGKTGQHYPQRPYEGHERPRSSRVSGHGGRGGQRLHITAGFKVGQRVRLEDLFTKSMNGKEGYVYEVTRERVNITIRDELAVDYVAIQPKNLRILEQPKASKTKAAAPNWAQYKNDIRQKKRPTLVGQPWKYQGNQEKANAPHSKDDESVGLTDTEDNDECKTDEKRRVTQRKLMKDLKARGLRPNLYCDSADDAVSVVTFSDQTYVLDLYVQKKNRERDHTQECIDEAMDLYHIALEEGAEKDEGLFRSIFSSILVEKEPIFKERDEIADNRLEDELDRQNARLEKKKNSAECDDEEEDFAYNEEELYTEIGQYEPVVRIPDQNNIKEGLPWTKKTNTGEKVSDQSTEALDTGCNCQCTVM